MGLLPELLFYIDKVASEAGRQSRNKGVTTKSKGVEKEIVEPFSFPLDLKGKRRRKV